MKAVARVVLLLPLPVLLGAWSWQEFSDDMANKWKGTQDAAETASKISKLIYEFFKLIFGFVDLIGVTAFFLMIVTMFILWAVTMVSPVAKAVNYVFVVASVAGFSLWSGIAPPDIAKYAGVMAAPFAAAYLFAFVWRGLRSLLPGHSRAARLGRVAELSSQLNMAIREL